jgi:dATP/dGTP diphosphohydrolase
MHGEQPHEAGCRCANCRGSGVPQSKAIPLFPPCPWCGGEIPDEGGFLYRDKAYCSWACHYEQFQKDQNYGRKEGEAGGVVKDKIITEIIKGLPRCDHACPPCSACITAEKDEIALQAQERDAWRAKVAEVSAPFHALRQTLPAGSAERKEVPLARGLLDYFPAALAAVAHVSKVGNDQHSPGEPIHWARGKSTDHADCILRHLVDRDEIDVDGTPHVDKVAWRALALAQEWHEAHGAPLARGAKLP